MNRHPKKSLLLVSTLFLVFISFTFPTSSALSQSSSVFLPAAAVSPVRLAGWLPRLIEWPLLPEDLPGAFGKTDPENGATGVELSPTLSWTASGDAEGYEYCVDTTEDPTCSTTWTPTTLLSVQIGPLDAGTIYYWHVRAYIGGEYTYSDGLETAFWSFTVGPPEAFSKSSPTDGAEDQETSLTLSWGASVNADSYEYCYDTTTGCTSWTSTGAGQSALISGLTPGETYYWQVQARNTFGVTQADGGAYWSFTIGTPPASFSKTSPGNGVPEQLTSLTLEWEASGGATSYAYCYATTTGCTNWTTPSTATSASISGLTPGETYYWQVKRPCPGNKGN